MAPFTAFDQTARRRSGPRLAAFVCAALLWVPGAAAAISVRDVIELSRARVSEDVLVELVETGGSVFYLTADDILELKRAGVSDRVVLAMVRSERAMRDRTEAQEAAIAEVRLMAELLEATRLEVEAARAASAAVVVEPAPQIVPVPYPALLYGGRNARPARRGGGEARGAGSATARPESAPTESPRPGAIVHPMSLPPPQTAARPAGRPFWVVNGSGWIVK